MKEHRPQGLCAQWSCTLLNSERRVSNPPGAQAASLCSDRFATVKQKADLILRQLVKRRWVRVLALFLLFCLCDCSAQKDKKEMERYILDSERQWAESVATGDTSAIQRILADDFIGVDPQGRLYTKQQMIEETHNAPKYFVSNRLNDVRVRFYGNTAVAQGSETWEKHSGERGRFVWTDTWLQRNGHWQIVAAEDLIAPEKSE